MVPAGVAILALGFALALRSAFLLMGRGRPRRGPRPAFVLAGPYLRIRNPLLAGVVLSLAGAAFAARSWCFGAVAALAGGAAHLWVVSVEEPRLKTRFGQAYAEYLRRVPRWVPARRAPADDAG